MNQKDRDFIQTWVEVWVRNYPPKTRGQKNLLIDLLDRAEESDASFGGATFDPERDEVRLNAQLRRVRDVLDGGDWWYLRQVSAATGDPEASVSARIRDLRKPQFGGHQIEREFVRRGLHRYRMLS